MASSRFTITEIHKSNIRIKSLPISNDATCEFYVRLFSMLGFQPEKHYEGFTFRIYDKENDFYFEAGLTGFGAGYFAEEDNSKTQKILNEFNAIVYANDLKLKECSITFAHDFGETSFGYKNGHFSCE